MKVIAEREKLLSNFEVLEHLKEIQAANNWKTNTEQKRHKRSFNPDLEAVTGEVISFLSKSQTATQTTDTITQCMHDLAPFELEKIERLQIINSAPHSLVNLYAIVEECDQRFSESQIQEMLDIVQRHFPQEDEHGEEGQEEEEEGEGEEEAPEEEDKDVEMKE